MKNKILIVALVTMNLITLLVAYSFMRKSIDYELELRRSEERIARIYMEFQNDKNLSKVEE